MLFAGIAKAIRRPFSAGAPRPPAPRYPDLEDVIATSRPVMAFDDFMAQLVSDIREFHSETRGYFLADQIDSMTLRLAEYLNVQAPNTGLVREALRAMPGARCRKMRVSQDPDLALVRAEMRRRKYTNERAWIYYVPPEGRAAPAHSAPANDESGLRQEEARPASGADPQQARSGGPAGRTPARSEGGPSPARAKKQKTRTIADVRAESARGSVAAASSVMRRAAA